MTYPKQSTGDAAQQPNGAAAEVSPSPRLPEVEQRVLAFWKADDTFRESIRRREGEAEWVFNDGPPFANGLPHYGHLLTGYAKDVFPRFQTMRGKKVERRFGWDTHGLPAELEAMKQLGITEKRQIEEMGIAAFNAKARDAVLQYTREWEDYVTRQARWVDFEHGYKTLDLGYMESVLWAFKQLHEKGLAYEGSRILPYCWRDETPLSNHELRMDDDVYQMRQDPSVTVTFPFMGERAAELGLDGVRALAWTTTPWTLPTNAALAVGPEISYAVVPAGPAGGADGGAAGEARYLLAVDLVGNHAKDLGYESAEAVNAAVERTVPGAELAEIEYARLFDYFADSEVWGTARYWRVLVDDYVSTTDGTGIVHQAPAYGEDDYRITAEAGMPVIVSVDDGGRFIKAVTDVAGELWMDANRPLIRLLKQNGRLLREASYEHSYPHCWRCRNPLIYKAVSSWFVRVTDIKQRMLEVNEQITWVPENVKHGQFGKWLEGARDWSISRNRYWGSPIPVWKSDDPEHPRVDVYGSLAELEADFGELPRNEQGEVDLHRPYIDSLTRPNPDDPSGASTMRRIEDVFDVWFDSGSMPFAQAHYPFENREWFDTHQPADFIVEYIGQTRGWFYLQHVLATALFDRPAFKNVISHGIVLGSDGNKMSKSLRNYPDVNEVFDRDGSDAMRWFLMASPVVRGGNLVVTEEGIREGVRQFILPLWNSYYFFSLYANADGIEAERRTDSSDPLDRYILAKTGRLVREVEAHLDGLDTTSAAETLRDFAETLTNWYVRRSRDRFWEGTHGENGKESNRQAFDTLFTVLETVARVAAPMAPLVTEEIWRGLTGGRSVHLADWPDAAEFPADDELIVAMDEVRQITSQALALRKARRLRVRLPLSELTVVSARPEALQPFAEILREELNVKQVTLVEQTAESAAEHGIVHTLAVNARAAGPRIGKNVQQAIRGAKSGDWSETDGVVTAGGIALEPGEYELTLSAGDGADGSTALALLQGGGFVLLRTDTTPELEAEGIARDAIRAVQEARKNAGLDVSDRIVLALNAEPAHVDALRTHGGLIAAETLAAGFAVQEAIGIDAIVDDIRSPGDGVFVTGAKALGTDKAPLIITIDTTGLDAPEEEDAR
ncbi:isoleucine--tRNA ligase [Leucobacter sp. OLJS4]|uniref:isoleucine--tRNA ligase n=1 Tax=unclassified Leucobacter TaxID=2621730 RepID=UPI000C189CC0|nr:MULTISPECIES: isoleucine--tRNA ligase [unclassified Leucobacter]PII81500.1 isoleucine--tRNA ligase [Leucobacter sp. OLCALW19]PII86170.1 isoleucine--tRNA ligase [Leucobacter sp. OLTLW20]PII90065.1 isoleucine--tRNA ligase [Leucobacter sp. OLAS13]PII97098.1 isoleucine--tRNA ligase [Leucobacter sp. OLDS2]PIJ02208.1 isoleucine--tRNA ligase [Leucobacter sp. OLIS6]